MTSIDIQEPVKRQKPHNLAIHVPSAFWAHLEANDDSELIMRCAVGRHGPFIYIVNPVQQKRWQRELKENEKGE